MRALKVDPKARDGMEVLSLAILIVPLSATLITAPPAIVLVHQKAPYFRFLHGEQIGGGFGTTTVISLIFYLQLQFDAVLIVILANTILIHTNSTYKYLQLCRKEM